MTYTKVYKKGLSQTTYSLQKRYFLSTVEDIDKIFLFDIIILRKAPETTVGEDL
jgi:hypothetical protein